MTLDYDSHPSELVTGGESLKNHITVKDLRDAIPAHCFKPSYFWSFFYLARDLFFISTLAYAAYTYIPLIDSPAQRWVAWAAYGIVQGLQMTGLWVIGHECGHGGFSSSNMVNNVMGWIIHSSLMTPYFAWRSTHRRHHIYANNLAKDHNYVPPRKDEYAASLMYPAHTDSLAELTEDSPIVTIVRIVIQQLLGWPWYILTNITASEGSLNKSQSKQFFGNSHLHPWSSLFRPEEAPLMILSDIGIGLMAYALYQASQVIGHQYVMLLYLQPYLYVNHWIVAITYLHHTHPDLPKFEPEAWTFLRGALATVDREMGWVGKHMLHNIADYHVIHHLFSRLPQYHAEEATKAIQPLLGKDYREDKQRAFLPGLYESFTKCQWVEPDKPDAKPADRMLWYKAGPSPPIERRMINKGWN